MLIIATYNKYIINKYLVDINSHVVIPSTRLSPHEKNEL